MPKKFWKNLIFGFIFIFAISIVLYYFNYDRGIKANDFIDKYWLYAWVGLCFVIVIISNLVSLSGKLPAELKKHFTEIGVKFTGIIWNEQNDLLTGKKRSMEQYFEGIYRNCKIKYEHVPCETDVFTRKLVFYHNNSLDTGLLFEYYTEVYKNYIPIRSQDECEGILTKPIKIPYLNLSNYKCYSRNSDKIEIFLQDTSIVKTFQSFFMIIKDIKNFRVVINDNCIKTMFADNYLPKQNLLNVIYDLSMAL